MPKKIDKDIELLKIQIYSHEVYAEYTTFNSMLLSTLIAVMVLLLGFLYEGIFSMKWFVISFIVVILIVFFAAVYSIWTLKKNKRKIQSMISKITEDKPLPDLDKM